MPPGRQPATGTQIFQVKITGSPTAPAIATRSCSAASSGLPSATDRLSVSPDDVTNAICGSQSSVSVPIARGLRAGRRGVTVDGSRVRRARTPAPIAPTSGPPIAGTFGTIGTSATS